MSVDRICAAKGEPRIAAILHGSRHSPIRAARRFGKLIAAQKISTSRKGARILPVDAGFELLQPDADAMMNVPVSRLGTPETFSTACRPFTGTRYEEHVMTMNKNQVKGRVKEAQGFVKEVAGKLVGNEKLEEKGKIQKIVGEAQAEVGDVKQDKKNSKKRR